ncbi:MAG: hypothetical protein IJU89_04315 [Alphaproteobacteria bacterium]|nr:hypothetical protein [Alphaproteobacteria bacterium]
MKHLNLKFLILSLPAAATMFPYSVAYGALRINNSSVIQSQIQNSVAAHEMAAAAQIQTPQPARVIANANGTTTTVSANQMDACNAIYPGGTFDWLRPTMGIQSGASPKCSAYVEMRAYDTAGTGYKVLATGYLASGDAVKCNIDNFPDITVVGRDFTYPADAAPTVEDVERVMVAENKTNAGFKILAAAVVGGLGGNIVGKAEKGNDSLLGTNKEKLKSTAIGAVGGAALMTASTQINDYKAGNMILSTGMNAAAGAVAGNVMATGEDVLQIDNCTVYKKEDTTEKDTEVTTKKDPEVTKCIYGTIKTKIDEKTKVSGDTNGYFFYNYATKEFYKCEKIDQKDEYTKCQLQSLVVNEFDDSEVNAACKDDKFGTDDCKNALEKLEYDEKYVFDDNNSGKAKSTYEKTLKKQSSDEKSTIVKLLNVKQAGSRTGAMVALKKDTPNNIFGYSKEDWRNRGDENKTKLKLHNETVYDLYGNPMDAKISDFTPAYKSASDGSVIDFNNAARTKSTVIGAGAGGALGALSGAAGAESAVQERWQTAMREYDDSLNNIVCYTGARYLSRYNDVVIIPEMKNLD